MRVAKHSTIHSLKFRKLVRALSLPAPYVLGHLEFIWQFAHNEAAKASALESPVFEDMADVELIAEWNGEPGALADALLVGGWFHQRDGGYVINDYEEHAPHWVKDCIQKRSKRRGAGDDLENVVDTSATRRRKSTTCLRRGEDFPHPLTYTDTYTDTEIKIADKDSLPTRARARGGNPEPLSNLQESAISSLSAQEADWWGRVSWLVEDYALPWWQDTMRAYVDAGGNGAELEELVRRYEDATSPTAREAKGVGEFTQRNGAAKAMMRDMTRMCKRVGARWAKYPEEG